MSGASLLSRPMNYLSGAINWPCCAKCRTVDGNMPIVAAYGVTNETDLLVEVWVEHHGERDGVTLIKDAMWGEHSLSGELRRMAFFDPQGVREIRRHGMPAKMTGRLARVKR